VRAVVDDLAVPATDPDIRAAIERATATPDGLARAYDRLASLDPWAAARIERSNRRRVVRALEVIELTGRPFSSVGPGLTSYPRPALDVTLLGITRSRAELAARVARRFTTMRELGLIDEVRALADRSRGMSRTARQAIGYKEVLDHLAGEIATLDEALDLAVRRTRKLARRQRVWFRRDPRIIWLDGGANFDELVADALARWTPTVSSSTVS
jgi:tRNA dimethylallyltransferase